MEILNEACGDVYTGLRRRVGLRFLQQGTVEWLRKALFHGELSWNALARGLWLTDGKLNFKQRP